MPVICLNFRIFVYTFPIGKNKFVIFLTGFKYYCDMCLAIPGRIKTMLPSDGVIKKAKVVFGNIVKETCLDMVPQAKVGDYVLVHAGVAINLVNKEEARKTFEYLKKIGELDELTP